MLQRTDPVTGWRGSSNRNSRVTAGVGNMGNWVLVIPVESSDMFNVGERVKKSELEPFARDFDETVSVWRVEQIKHGRGGIDVVNFSYASCEDTCAKRVWDIDT